MRFSRQEYWNGLPFQCPLCESESASRSPVSDSLQPHGLYSPWNSPGQNTGVGSLSFSSRSSHCRQILYQVSHKGSPRILEWVAYPFSSRSSRPRFELGSPVLQADSLPTELSGNVPYSFLLLAGAGYIKMNLSQVYMCSPS